MNPRRLGTPTLAPLAGFLFGMLAARLAVPLTLYLLTLWVAWRWFGTVGPPDWAQLLQAGFGWDNGPPALWWLVGAAVLMVAGLVLIVRGSVAQPALQPGNGPTAEADSRMRRRRQYVGCILVMLGILAAWPEPINALLFLVFGGLYAGWAVMGERARTRA